MLTRRGDRDKWDQRYRQLGDELRRPASLLVSLDEVLPRSGRALDVAGGAGRNAVWLAQRGLDVSVVDISPVGLALAERAASSAGVTLAVEARDVEQASIPPGPWDVIVDVYFLWRPLFADIAAALAPKGVFVFAQPTVANLERHARPGRAHLLAAGELAALIAGLDLDILQLTEDWNADGRHEAQLVARRPALP